MPDAPTPAHARTQVPDEFLLAFLRDIDGEAAVVPPGCRAMVRRSAERALRSGDRAARFFVFVTAVYRCTAVREMVTTPANRARVDRWTKRSIAESWDKLLLGSDRSGRPGCTTASDAMYGTVLDFAAAMQTEYMCREWRLV